MSGEGKRITARKAANPEAGLDISVIEHPSNGRSSSRRRHRKGGEGKDRDRTPSPKIQYLFLRNPPEDDNGGKREAKSADSSSITSSISKTDSYVGSDLVFNDDNSSVEAETVTSPTPRGTSSTQSVVTLLEFSPITYRLPGKHEGSDDNSSKSSSRTLTPEDHVDCKRTPDADASKGDQVKVSAVILTPVTSPKTDGSSDRRSDHRTQVDINSHPKCSRKLKKKCANVKTSEKHENTDVESAKNAETRQHSYFSKANSTDEKVQSRSKCVDLNNNTTLDGHREKVKERMQPDARGRHSLDIRDDADVSGNEKSTTLKQRTNNEKDQSINAEQQIKHDTNNDNMHPENEKSCKRDAYQEKSVENTQSKRTSEPTVSIHATQRPTSSTHTDLQIHRRDDNVDEVNFTTQNPEDGSTRLGKGGKVGLSGKNTHISVSLNSDGDCKGGPSSDVINCDTVVRSSVSERAPAVIYDIPYKIPKQPVVKKHSCVAGPKKANSPPKLKRRDTPFVRGGPVKALRHLPLGKQDKNSDILTINDVPNTISTKCSGDEHIKKRSFNKSSHNTKDHRMTLSSQIEKINNEYIGRDNNEINESKIEPVARGVQRERDAITGPRPPIKITRDNEHGSSEGGLSEKHSQSLSSGQESNQVSIEHSHSKPKGKSTTGKVEDCNETNEIDGNDSTINISNGCIPSEKQEKHTNEHGLSVSQNFGVCPGRY